MCVTEKETEGQRDGDRETETERKAEIERWEDKGGEKEEELALLQLPNS